MAFYPQKGIRGGGWSAKSRHGSIWAINLSEKHGNITNLGNIHYYEEIKQGNNGNIGNNGDN